MIHTGVIQLKNLFVLLIIPIFLAPLIILWNEYMFYSFLYSFWLDCLWLMIVSYNIVAYYIVVRRNPDFLVYKSNKYIHWVFNILNSSLFLIYLKDINILSSVFYLIILIFFMSCYNAKKRYEGIIIIEVKSFLSLIQMDPKKFLVYLISISTMERFLLNDVVSSIISHSLKYEQFTILHSFTYEQFIYYIFYLEPFSVIFTFFLVLSTTKTYVVLVYGSKDNGFRKIWSDIKYFYSAKMLLDINIVISLTFFFHVLNGLYILW